MSSVRKLSDLSRTLANFIKSSHAETIEIPGQYEMAQNQVSRQNTVKIAGFKDEVKVFPSLRRPIKITMIGDDGKDYNFLVKNGEDLRQDQRIGNFSTVKRKQSFKAALFQRSSESVGGCA